VTVIDARALVVTRTGPHPRCQTLRRRKCPRRRTDLDPSTRLALYFSNTSVYFPPPSVRLGRRICCSSPLVATYTFNADFDRFAIGFEQAGGTTPGRDQNQAFELTIRPAAAPTASSP
jgi:hypothetical protein